MSIEPVAWYAELPDGKRSKPDFIRPEYPAYRGNYHLDGIPTIDLYPKSAIDELQRQLAEANSKADFFQTKHMEAELTIAEREAVIEKKNNAISSLLRICYKQCLQDGYGDVIEKADKVLAIPTDHAALDEVMKAFGIKVAEAMWENTYLKKGKFDMGVFVTKKLPIPDLVDKVLADEIRSKT